MKTNKTDSTKEAGQKTNDSTPRPGTTEALRPAPSSGNAPKLGQSSAQSAPASSSRVVPLKQNHSKSGSSQDQGRRGPTHDEIADRAKKLWAEHGRVPGSDQANWLEAEAQLKEEMGIKP
jgi:hypothetical protein